MGYTARMADYDPNVELNPNLPLTITAVLLLLGVATVYSIIFVF